MYSKLQSTKKNELGVSVNAGSCVKLAHYLDKESGIGKFFFSQNQDSVPLTEVIQKIDNNKKTLKNNQDKFYMLSYNPSQREIAHLIKEVTGKDNVVALSSLTDKEIEKVVSEFQDYVRDCMDIYARNFNRNKDLSSEDLLWFGRVETERHYTYLDEEVKDGLRSKGDLKEGLQLHAHVIVSRMDVTQTISLSPLAKSMGNVNVLNGKAVKNGFSMKGWQVDCFQHFGNKYGYIANADERFYYHDSSYSSYKNKIQNKIIHEVMEDMKEERQFMTGARNITLILHPTKKSVKLYLKQKIKNILLENESVI